MSQACFDDDIDRYYYLRVVKAPFINHYIMKMNKKITLVAILKFLIL